MKKAIQTSIVALTLAVTTLFGVVAPAVPAFAAVDPGSEINGGISAAGGSGQKLDPNLKTIVNLLLFVIGAIAVIVIVIGGLRYVLSGGDSSQITSAKNTILYAVVGLIVSLLAYAIVNFVVGQF